MAKAAALQGAAAFFVTWRDRGMAAQDPERPQDARMTLCSRLTMQNNQKDNARLRGAIDIFELRVLRVHVRPDLLMDGNPNRIDPDKWNPLIMSFQRFYGLAAGQVHGSRLADIPESAYRSPDIDRARTGEELARA
jgi:hypothetical protein